MNLKTLDTLLIDGDGVLWHASTPVAGLSHFFNVLAERRITWALLTNNSMNTVDMYVRKLNDLGAEAGPEQIFSSATATAEYLREHYSPGEPVYVIGEAGLKEAISGAGFTVLDGDRQPDHAVAVAVGMDRQITYGMLTVAMRLIRGGAEFVASNADRTFPTPAGLAPGAGTLVAALIAATDIQPRLIGKPETPIFEAAMKRLGANPETTAIIGDRLETDILGGHRAGIGTILVLTGVTDRALLAASAIKPDLVYESIAELADALADG